MKERIGFKVKSNGVTMKAIYNKAITTTVEISHEDFIIMINKMINRSVYHESAISRALSIKGRCVKTSVEVMYNTNKELISVRCIDDNGVVPMEYKINVDKNLYETIMSHIIHEIFNINSELGKRLYIVSKKPASKDISLINSIINGESNIIFAKNFRDAVSSSNNGDVIGITVNKINNPNDIIGNIANIA